jgi:farnesyl diphosphate synthase
MSNSKAARRAKFEGTFDLIRDEILAHCQRENMPPEAVTWFRKVRTQFPSLDVRV